MAKIEQAKTYIGQDLDNIFFRPMLTGPGVDELGITVMYNMPVPTTLHYWQPTDNILQKCTSGQWSASSSARRISKTIDLKRVKAEIGYSADEYYNMVYGMISSGNSIDMGDLTATDLESAETALFRQAIAESIRATMWVGNTTASKYNTFDGFLKHLIANDDNCSQYVDNMQTADAAILTFQDLLNKASSELLNAKQQDNLAFFVTTDVYNNYEETLDSEAYESAYLAQQDGRKSLHYRGIPVVDVRIGNYLPGSALPQSFVMLTDRRNLALAVNTSDFPGTEVRMWYNPDAMENRQRAVFMAGCNYLMPELTLMATEE